MGQFLDMERQLFGAELLCVDSEKEREAICLSLAQEPHRLLPHPDGFLPLGHHLLDGIAQLVRAVDEADDAYGVRRVCGERTSSVREDT